MARRKSKNKWLQRKRDKIVLVFDVVAVILLLLSSLAVYINPADIPVAALLCLAFPFFTVLLIVAIIISLLVNRKLAIVPVIGMLMCFPALRNYCPVNLFSDKSAVDSLKVLSFNTRNFGGHESDDLGKNYVLSHMMDSKADIICFQEGACEKEYYEKVIFPELKKFRYYYSVVRSGRYNTMGIFSKYPIVHKEKINRMGYNIVMAYTLRLDNGDSLLVVNNHLVSNALSEEDRSVYSSVVKGEQNVSQKKVEESSRNILKQLLVSAKRRGEQVDSVRLFLDRHKGQSMLVLGDFNDTPVSYAHQRLSDGLTDCFRAAGNGIGRSFNKDAFVVRIDHIFCSKDWEPASCKVEKVYTYSDHFPIECVLYKK